MYQLLSPFQMLGILLKHCILVQKLLYSAEIQPTKIILSKQKQTKGKCVILCHPCSLYPFIKIYWWAVLPNSSVNKASYQYTERKNLPIFPQTAFKKNYFQEVYLKRTCSSSNQDSEKVKASVQTCPLIFILLLNYYFWISLTMREK